LRAICASSALAVALLGLAAAPAHAALPSFTQQTGGANPLSAVSAASHSAPALADVDGDGDLDALSGDLSGAFFYFRNTGSATAPAFVAITGGSNPLNGQDVGSASRPAFGDLDGDGDLDLVVGTSTGSFAYFQNGGNANSPSFGAGYNSITTKDVGDYASPALGDLDGDGDLDVIAGDQNGVFHYLRNTGSATAAAFSEITGAGNPLNGQDVGSHATPSLADLDGDGDLDLVAGEAGGALFVFENTGSATNPVFVARTGSANPLDGQSAGARSGPALGDFDGDGDADLVAGGQAGGFSAWKNQSAHPLGTASEVTGGANPLNGFSVGSLSAPALGDIDGDGDLDLFAGERFGTFFYFRNTGSKTSPAFAAVTGAGNPMNGFDVGLYSAPALGDLDGDGELDLVSGERYGTVLYYRNSGSITAPLYVARTGSLNPFDGIDLGSWSVPTLGDLDGDGDLDALVSENSGALHYLRNTGSATAPAFVEMTGGANPLDGAVTGSYPAPAFGDYDGDGDLDLVVGTDNGTFVYFANTGSATNPLFVPRTGSQNPFNGADVGSGAAPTSVDLDGNGRLDLVTGDTPGGFHLHNLPEPARGMLLAAGIALLRWLSRARREPPR
jgi:hypothetical protein